MRYLWALLAYIVSLIVIAALAFVIVIVLAGPHAGLLPRWAEILVLSAGWIAVVAVPIWVAVRVYKRTGA
jgi:hypothetical protein